MQRYVLRCDKGHQAVSWFRSTTDANRVVIAGLALCPDCDDQMEVGLQARAPAVRRPTAEDEPPARRLRAN